MIYTYIVFITKRNLHHWKNRRRYFIFRGLRISRSFISKIVGRNLNFSTFNTKCGTIRFKKSTLAISTLSRPSNPPLYVSWIRRSVVATYGESFRLHPHRILLHPSGPSRSANGPEKSGVSAISVFFSLSNGGCLERRETRVRTRRGVARCRDIARGSECRRGERDEGRSRRG